MKRIRLILILQTFITCYTYSQSFSVDDLLTLSSLPSKNVDRFMKKNGFSLFSTQRDNDTLGASFMPDIKPGKADTRPKRSVDIYVKNDSKFFSLHTSSSSEYIDGQRNLIKKGFFYDVRKEIAKEHTMLFQKANIAIRAISEMQDSIPVYTFKLEVTKIP